ncbi:uncharacterized protein LOC120662916 [Panicum virgatum]|uniref:uncharacterized protein LOC120662916 n=1 Tax=Panicum virgatum TaxID=38727 RepID=UPI0019D57C0A|nr:uncharacterized protein LOC120662916 [Panicum virgatum]
MSFHAREDNRYNHCGCRQGKFQAGPVLSSRTSMEHNSIDCNEEESENSSENSFNEVANVALAVGYAMSGLLAPPQLPLVYQPVYLQLDLNGQQWVENVLADASRCSYKRSFRHVPLGCGD